MAIKMKLWQFTDLHLHLRAAPEDLDVSPNQTALPQSNEIIDACLAAFLAEPGCDTLLLSGDLTQTGHPEEHREMVRKLRRVQEAGKRVIAITASHDYKTIGKENCGKLRALYAEFGLNGSIARYEDGQAYVVQLAPELRLLCVNDHGRSQPPPWLPWAIDQIGQARAAGDFIFGMTHLPSLPPSPIYPLIDPRAMLSNYHETTRTLANAGLRFLLTGHSHMHNIAHIVTPEGNPYWDINTSALVGYPGKFRQIEIDAGQARITSREIPYTHAFGELSARDFLRRTFDTVLDNLVDGLDHDFDLLVRSVGTGTNPAPVRKRKWLLKPAGKIICRTTLGGLARLLFCKIPKEARKLLFIDVIIGAMRGMYAGEEPHSAETAIGQAFIAYGRRLKFLLKKLGVEDAPAFMLSLVYDDSPDDEVTIPLG